jgi:CubicO group peptidase (beta-lactamase class C family)
VTAPVANNPPTLSNQKSSSKTISSFVFLKANNASLTADVHASITGGAISLTVTNDSPKAFIATFVSSDKSKVFIGAKLQQSGVTVNDFSSSISYKVMAEDSSTATYTIKVNFPPKSSEKLLTSFVFLKANNQGIPSDITGVISGNSVSLIIPPGMTTNNLIANFSNSVNSKVYVGSTLEQSGITSNNFSTTVNYNVVAQDSSVANYTVNLLTDTFPELDNLMNNVLANYDTRGISVAIVKDDKLVYAKSYGYAVQETGQKTTNNSLFRIASVSKPITAITILSLAQNGFLSLNQTVFGTNGILGNSFGTPPAGSKIDQITIQNLLDHKSGWTNIPNDPMFNNLTWDFNQLITDMVENRPLVYNPGDTSIYLNFGYCVLGRVIEKVTGMSYDSYVKSAILQNCGISDMKIGGSTLAERNPNEVEYYDTTIWPYVINLPRMDANGGWIASATDLAKFISRIDRENFRPDILSNATLQQMYFGYSNWIFYGGLRGTSAVITRRDDHFSFVILYNSNNPEINNAYDQVSDLIYQRLEWPNYDLF